MTWFIIPEPLPVFKLHRYRDTRRDVVAGWRSTLRSPGRPGVSTKPGIEESLSGNWLTLNDLVQALA